MKVIASSLRKGNIVEKDSQLYVVLNAESFHPGKGTPTTQIDMRRISDGVKITDRYKTTEQVERAYVEDQEFSFLYEDADGMTFMNSENYDQVVVANDVVGDAKPYLQEGMKVLLSIFNSVAVAIQIPPPDRVLVLQAGQAVQRCQDQRTAAHSARHPHRRADRRRVLRRARQGLRRGFSAFIK